MIAVILRDIVGIGGGALVAVGAWQIYPPAGLIVGGALMIAGAWLHGRADADTKMESET